MSLVASLIVKNERSRYMAECIGHLRAFCDLLVVVDDGSTDGTGEWLDDNTDEKMVVQHLDPEDGFFAGHEGRKRQALLDFTLEQQPEWVLAIDADEFISDGVALREFCEQPRPIGTLEMAEVWQASNAGLLIRMDGGWRPHPVPILWRPAQRPPRQWRIANRALACGREPENLRAKVGRARPTGVSILHFGWAREAGRQARYDRYVTADGGRFHRNTHLDSIMWPDDKVSLELRRWPPALASERKLIIEQSS